MSFWEKFKEFDKMMSEPAIAIRIEKTITIPDKHFVQSNNQMQELMEENKQLRNQLQIKKIKAIDIEHRLLE